MGEHTDKDSSLPESVLATMNLQGQITKLEHRMDAYERATKCHREKVNEFIDTFNSKLLPWITKEIDDEVETIKTKSKVYHWATRGAVGTFFAIFLTVFIGLCVGVVHIIADFVQHMGRG